MKKIAMLCLLGWLGCGDDHQGSGGSDGGAGAGGSGGSGGSGGNDMCAQAGSVCGTAIDTFLTEAGQTQKPRDLSGASIEAITFDAAGAAVHHPGTGHSDGTYTIPNMPDGAYTLSWSDPDLAGGTSQRYIVTSKHKLDLGLVFYGRADATLVTMSPTDLVFNVSNLEEWFAGDRLQITAFGAGGFAYDASGTDPNTGNPLPGNPTAGQGALSGFTVDWSQTSLTHYIDQPMLVLGPLGDRLVMTQLHLRHNPSADYLTIGRIFRAPAFTMGENEPNMLTGAFESVPQNQVVSLSWKRSQFAGYVTAIHPSATSLGDPGLTVGVAPRNDAYTYVFPSLAEVNGTTPATGDIDLHLQYGNPFPPSWSTWVTSCQFATATLPYAGGNSHMTMLGYVCGGLNSAQDGTVRPTISPPRDLRVNGEPATGDIVHIGTTPLLSWTAPELGTPTNCTVIVRKHPEAGGTNVSVSITVPPDASSVRIPPGIIEATGFVYAFRVGCSDDLGSASAFTGAMTP